MTTTPQPLTDDHVTQAEVDHQKTCCLAYGGSYPEVLWWEITLLRQRVTARDERIRELTAAKEQAEAALAALAQVAAKCPGVGYSNSINQYWEKVLSSLPQSALALLVRESEKLGLYDNAE